MCAPSVFLSLVPLLLLLFSLDQPSVAEASEEVSPTSQSDFHRISGLEDSKYLVALLFFGKKGEVLVEKDFFNTTTRLMEHVFPGSEFQNFTLRTTMTRQVENSPSSSNTLIIIISSVSAMVVCARLGVPSAVLDCRLFSLLKWGETFRIP